MSRLRTVSYRHRKGTQALVGSRVMMSPITDHRAVNPSGSMAS